MDTAAGLYKIEIDTGRRGPYGSIGLSVSFPAAVEVRGSRFQLSSRILRVRGGGLHASGSGCLCLRAVSMVASDIMRCMREEVEHVQHNGIAGHTENAPW